MTRTDVTALVCGLAIAFSLVPVSAAAAERVTLSGAAVDVLSSPQDDISVYVTDFVNKAQKRVWLAGSDVSSPEVVRALIQARARGLDVRVLVDRTTAVGGLRQGAIAVYVNQRHAMMHHQFIVCDDDRVALGSATFSKVAMSVKRAEPAAGNAENMNLFVGAPGLAKQYAAEFARLAAESTKLL